MGRFKAAGGGSRSRRLGSRPLGIVQARAGGGAERGGRGGGKK